MVAGVVGVIWGGLVGGYERGVGRVGAESGGGVKGKGERGQTSSG